ncbi:hypothetical protein [Pseudoalteromonas phage PH357]|nr:hypothetical protein [Pseudoalteromonas phage PH357]
MKTNIYTKKQALALDTDQLDFTKPTHYHMNKDIDLILKNGWLYSEKGLYARDSKKFNNCLQEY